MLPFHWSKIPQKKFTPTSALYPSSKNTDSALLPFCTCTVVEEYPDALRVAHARTNMEGSLTKLDQI